MTKPRAFAMIEVVFATAIVGGLVVGALTLVASTAGHKANAANLARGQVLCRSLAEEICTRPVINWSSGGLDIEIDLGILVIKGVDATGISITAGTGNRSTFSTVDAYKDYVESPPKDEDGNTLAGYAGWARTVSVESVTLADPTATSTTETGLRRITVRAMHQGRVMATSTFLRSSEWERVQP